MKKLFSILLVLFYLMLTAVAFADDLGIQIIGDPNASPSQAERDGLSPDDMQLNKSYWISGKAIVCPREFRFVDFFAQYTKDSPYSYKNWDGAKNRATVFTHAYSQEQIKGGWRDYLTSDSATWIEAGEGGCFAWLRADITNSNSEVESLTEAINIKVVYAEEFEFGGWTRLIDTSKIDYEYSDGCVSRLGYELSEHPSQILMHPANANTIGFMGTGYYVLGCTLPKYVVEDTASPLRFEIHIGDDVFIYHIRK